MATENQIAIVPKAPSNYGIELHQHRFAAWAAGRAASVIGSRFKVIQGREILETCGFDEHFSKPELLPASKDIDEKHRQWRKEIINAAKSHDLEFTHGVAAKLINVYLKCRFVCGGCHVHENVCNLHPPIDSVLLQTLAKKDCGNFKVEWLKADKTRWSKFNSEDYEQVIRRIRETMKDQPLWKIEEYWAGNQ